jgi:2-methylcitrate dehydratase PrpD
MSIMPVQATDTTSDASAAHAARMLGYLHQQGTENDSVLENARRCLLDSLGCGLMGAKQPWGHIVAEEALSDGSQGQCSILGQTGTVAPSQAALCNGTAMHGFELDDLLPAALIHPGAVIVPAAFAAAEAIDASGLQLLRGIAMGYEATSRISRALGTNPSNLGFHKTSVVGPVSGAIAASVAMGLDFKQLQWAVGLACSCASGIKSFAAGGGGMVKRLHAGRAAEAGVRMAMLARRGFTAPLNAIDGKFGLLDVFGGSTAQPELLDEGLGANWAVDDVWVKVYPICGWIQGVVQLLLAMRAQEKFDPASVARITVATSSFAVKYNGNTSPQDTMDAQYSIPYCVAVALTGDPMDPDEYAPERLGDRQRQAIIHKVELKPDPSADSVYPKQFACKVTLEFVDGRTKTAQTFDAHGTPGDPCSPQELVEKFSRLTELSMLDIDAGEVVSRVNRLASGLSVRELAASLRPHP